MSVYISCVKVAISLKRPVRISAADKAKKGKSASNNGVEVALRLEQEFVRLRAVNDGVIRKGTLLTHAPLSSSTPSRPHTY